MPIPVKVPPTAKETRFKRQRNDASIEWQQPRLHIMHTAISNASKVESQIIEFLLSFVSLSPLL